jgi:hypothetical protein
MSKVKVGDRVKIVIEDDVIYVEPDGTVVLDGGSSCWQVGKNGLVSIEVIAPPFVLPTKRWAQVLDGDNVLWTLTDETTRVSEWLSLQGSLLYGYQLLERPRLRVISEGIDE